jgi:hypothetical protein
MSGITGADDTGRCAEEIAHHRPKAIASVTHGEQFQGILRPCHRPAFGNGVGSFVSSETALKLIWNN